MGDSRAKLTTHYFWGEDIFAAQCELEALAEARGVSLRYLEPSDFASKSLAEWCDDGRSGLLGTQLMVLCDVSAWPAALQREVVSALSSERSGECVVWEKGVPAAGFLPPRQVKKMGLITRVFRSNPAVLPEWVKGEVAARGGSINGKAATELVRRLGTDRFRLLSEIEKLVLGESDITLESVQSYEDEGEDERIIFKLLDAMSAKREREATMLLTEIFMRGESEFYVLSMMAYQLRTLLLVRHVSEALGRDVALIAKQAKLHPYVVERSLGIAGRASHRAWVAMLVRVLAVDVAIKRGRVDMRTAVWMLLLSFVQEPVAAN